MALRKSSFKIFLTILFVLIFSASAFPASQQTSSTLASTIITNARSYIHEATASFWTDAELLVWLNDGTLDIASRTHCLQATESVTMIADTIEYTISSNYVGIIAAVYNPASGASKGLIRGSINAVGKSGGAAFGDTTTPTYFYEFAGKVGIYPALTSTTTETTTIYLVSRPAAVTSTDNVLVPAIYDRALTLYIAAQAFMKSGRFGKAGRMMAEYYTELDRYRLDYVMNPGDIGEAVK